MTTEHVPLDELNDRVAALAVTHRIVSVEKTDTEAVITYEPRGTRQAGETETR